MGKCRIGEIAPPLPAGLRDLGSISSAFSSRLSLYFHETYKSFAPNAPRICGNSGASFPVQDFHNIVAEIHRFRKQAKPFRRSPAYQSPFAGIHSASGTSITIPRTGFHLHKNQALPSRHTMSSSPPLTGRQFLLRITHPSARRKEAAASSPYIPSHAVSRLPLLRDGQFHL